MKYILNCFNLIGDSFYLLAVVKKYIADNPGTVEALVVHPGLAWEMYSRALGDSIPMFVQPEEAQAAYPNATVLILSAGQAADISFNPKNMVDNRQLHISECWAKILGFEMHAAVDTSWQYYGEDELPRTFIAISPYSRSCTRHSTGIPNKTLPANKWEYLIRYLRRQGLPIKVIAGPDDLPLDCSIPLNDYFTAKNLQELEHFLKSCALLMSVDNGLGHLASALHTPMISIWPKVSAIDFIAPRFGKRTTLIITVDPNKITPAELLTPTRAYTKILLNGVNSYEEILREG